MGYMTDGLTFNTLREANVARLPHFKNSRGEVVHKADGSDWSLMEWGCALAGEVGELCNKIKKIVRNDVTLREARGELAKEIADVQTYLDILAFRAGVNLGSATIHKFNEVSDRIGSPVWIDADGWHSSPE